MDSDSKTCGFCKAESWKRFRLVFHTHDAFTIHPARPAYKTRARPGGSRPYKTDRYLHRLRLSIGSRDASTAREKDVSHHHR